jgi:hypothetical protein
VKLPRCLQDARFRAFGKNHPLRMPLQFFDDIANETHGDRLKAGGAIAKSFCESIDFRLSTAGKPVTFFAHGFTHQAAN